MPVRGVRGATASVEDRPEAILAATRELLEAIMSANPSMQQDDIASVLFTVTEDLRSAYPAAAAREMGWQMVPLMCAQEIPVPDSLPKCVRVLLHWNTELQQSSIRHIYMGEAAKLRPDLSREN